MSGSALGWAKKTHVGSQTAKHVLQALADWADDQGSCYPSVQLIMDVTELSDRSVRNALRRLEELGLLSTERTRRKNGSMGANRYFLKVGAKPKATGAEAGDSGGEPPAGDADGNHRHQVQDPLQEVQDPPAGDAGLSKDEPPIEPPKEPERERADARSTETGVDDQADESASGSDAEERQKRWAVFWRKWPNTVVDDRDAALKAWGEVPSAQLQDAIDGIDPFFAESKRKGRTKPLSASKYLRQAKWDGVLKPDVADGQVKVLGPWTKAWIAVLVDMLEAGNARAARSMVQLALKGHGRSVHPTRPKTAELLARAETYRLIPAHHDSWAFFATWVERRSTELQWRVALPELPSTDEKPFFVAVPPDDVCRALGVPTLPPPTSPPPTDDEAIDAFA